MSSTKGFRCVAYVQDLTPRLDKLAPRSLRCVFVGHSRTQKGYQCYHPSSHRYFVFADVTFWKSKSYLDSTDSPTTPTTAPIPSPVEIVDTGGDQRRPLQGNMHCPLQIYHRRRNMHLSTQTKPPLSSTDLPPQDLDIPIALRKGTRSSTTYPISTFVTYDLLHPSLCQFASSISSKSIPKNYPEALLLPH